MMKLNYTLNKCIWSSNFNKTLEKINPQMYMDIKLFEK